MPQGHSWQWKMTVSKSRSVALWQDHWAAPHRIEGILCNTSGHGAYGLGRLCHRKPTFISPEVNKGTQHLFGWAALGEWCCLENRVQLCFESLSSGGGVLVDCNLTVSYSCWMVYLSSVNYFSYVKKKQIHSLTYCSLFVCLSFCYVSGRNKVRGWVW